MTRDLSMPSCCPLHTPLSQRRPAPVPGSAAHKAHLPHHPQRLLTRVISREAAAALMCRLGCRMELLQSRALAKVPTALREKSRCQEEEKAQASRRTEPDETKDKRTTPTPKQNARP